MTQDVGQRGPFDDCPTVGDEKKRLNAFLQRTSLWDYERLIRIGAFLARRNLGSPQVDYLKTIRDQEQAARSKNNSEDESSETDENRKIREAYEDDVLAREGDKGKWFRLHLLFRQNWHVHALVGCCSLGALIQGWDETAINGAQLYYPGALGIAKSTGKLGVINAAPYLMCLFSCCLTGPLNRYLGRKGTIMFCCVFCFASCLGQACCNTWQQLLACRLLLGFGIGPKTATIPIYAAESVPSEEIRGALVMTWQLCTALGIMLGYIFTYTFRNLGGNLKWRCMVGSPMVAPAILFFLMLALPESPRWHLLKAHRLERLEAHRLERLQAHRLERAERPRLLIYEQYDKAFHALRRLRHIKLQAARDLYTIDIWLRMGPLQFSDGSPDSGLGGDLKSRLKAWSPNVVTLLENPRCRRAMMSGLIVLSLQQLCGVNVFAYYSSSVFEKSLTFEQNAPNSTLAQQDHIALGYSLGFGAINFCLAILGLFLIDSVGRRMLLVLTFPLMGVFQFGTAFSFGKHSPATEKWRHIPVVVFAYLFCGVYSIGEGPVPLVYASEILPLEVRDTGVGILTGIYWGLNSLMALTWPTMFDKLNPEGSFCFYGTLNLIGWVLIIFFVPETSRYKLEEVDKVFRLTTLQIMINGWDQMKWLAGTKEKSSRRWDMDVFPVLAKRSNDTSSAQERELDDNKASTDSNGTINEDSSAANGHVAASPANGVGSHGNHEDK